MAWRQAFLLTCAKLTSQAAQLKFGDTWTKGPTQNTRGIQLRRQTPRHHFGTSDADFDFKMGK
jgi:hypothetical protein